MKNIVIEIDGVRHKLVDTKDYDKCYNCSLDRNSICSNASSPFDCTICGALIGVITTLKNKHFEIDKKK